MDKGISFSTPLVKSLLAGDKSQTRRIIKGLGELDCVTRFDDGSWHSTDSQGGHLSPLNVPYAIGDRCYVKEGIERTAEGAIAYRADGQLVPGSEWRWKPRTLPHRYMPKGLARLTLTVTNVRIERLQDISEADALAEGSFLRRCPCPAMQAKPRDTIGALFRQTGCAIHGTEWRSLWDSLHDKDGERWADNPWLTALTFTLERDANV